ncbi:MAG: hypothetical protein KIT35_09635 [Piscinibacter sp.]|uniref:hypothetical protein n=1 Tax=Piscinibacter sp. TaxID=1903157 RepID=UPI002590A61A|nr:hypothetical protein [Piscinibacter sp.]MCW5664084.1 hypothetical protein [Piscinibacter sp.]
MSMPLAPRRQRPRRIASVMLLVWLFATVASWAHACLVQPSAVMAGVPEHHPHSIAGAPAVGHVVAPHGTADEPDPARQACASFCESEQNIVAKAQPSKGDGAAVAAVLPPAAFDGWPALAPARAGPRWRPLAAPPPPGPPVAIAFLRLTL